MVLSPPPPPLSPFSARYTFADPSPVTAAVRNPLDASTATEDALSDDSDYHRLVLTRGRSSTHLGIGGLVAELPSVIELDDAADDRNRGGADRGTRLATSMRPSVGGSGNAVANQSDGVCSIDGDLDAVRLATD